VASLPKLVEKTTKLLGKYELTAAAWGHVGDGNISFMPRLDLAKKKDADKLINLSREFAELVAALGGTPSGTAGDGLIRSTAIAKVHGEEMAEVFAATKHIFDPHGVFAPMQKTDATPDFVRAHLRTEYINHTNHNHPTFH
jgi:FAD/FMN-containing dehydrogenase